MMNNHLQSVQSKREGGKERGKKEKAKDSKVRKEKQANTIGEPINTIQKGSVVTTKARFFPEWSRLASQPYSGSSIGLNPDSGDDESYAMLPGSVTNPAPAVGTGALLLPIGGSGPGAELSGAGTADPSDGLGLPLPLSLSLPLSLLAEVDLVSLMGGSLDGLVCPAGDSAEPADSAVAAAGMSLGASLVVPVVRRLRSRRGTNFFQE